MLYEVITDSLTGLSRVLVEFMRDQKSAVLELKTKTAVIGNLDGLDHGGRTVVAWSLNTPAIFAGEEFRTASVITSYSIHYTKLYDRVFHPRQVLDGTGDPEGEVQLRCDDLPRLPHLPVIGGPSRVDRRAGRADGRMEYIGKFLDEP